MSFFHSNAFLALRSRDFALISINQFCLVFAIVIQEVSLSFALYQMTQDPLSLGLIAVVELIPFLCLSLFAGHWADRYNRQKILQWSFMWSSSIPLLLALLFYADEQHKIPQHMLLLGIYTLIFILGILRGIYSPAFNSFRVFLIPTHVQNNAATWTALIWQIGAITAPLCAGLLISQIGIIQTFIGVFICCAVGNLALLNISKHSFPQLANLNISQSVTQACHFMFKQRLLFWGMLLDLCTALFCSILVLLPMVAQELLHTGVEGLSLLRAAPAFGTCLMMFILLRCSPMQHAWRNMLLSSIGIALLTLCFVLSSTIWLSALLLALIGALDSISIVIRQTLLQCIPPKDLLGRVAAINGVLVTSGNQLGSLQSSLTTRYLSIIPAVFLGAGLSLSLCLFSYLRTRDLLKPSSSHEKYTILTTGK
ncbi:MFS transporter [Acinetobacter sp. GXMZU3951]